MSAARRTARKPLALAQNMDYTLLLVAVSILLFGVVMVTSASVSVADRELGNPLYFGQKQLIFALLGLFLGFCAMRTPSDFLDRYSFVFLGLALVSLAVVLLPGVGRTFNGSQRWIGIGGFTIQVSEFARLGLMVYLASYLVRQEKDVQGSYLGFVKPMLFLALAAGLLIAEPDYGATVVLTTVVLGTMFLAGARLMPFIISFGVAAVFAVALIYSSPYRVERLVAFLDPWGNAFGSGYQLTQSLIAFGSGGWDGLGLGSSVQKLFYLPDAHNDFRFAIVGEELGLLGVTAVLALFATLIYRCFAIASESLALGAQFRAYLCYSVGVWVSCQVFVNTGVSMGMLPTKGLALPLMSAGGSAVMSACLAVGMVLRAHLENQMAQSQAMPAAKSPKRQRVEASAAPSEEVRHAA